MSSRFSDLCRLNFRLLNIQVVDQFLVISCRNLNLGLYGCLNRRRRCRYLDRHLNLLRFLEKLKCLGYGICGWHDLTQWRERRKSFNILREHLCNEISDSLGLRDIHLRNMECWVATILIVSDEIGQPDLLLRVKPWRVVLGRGLLLVGVDDTLNRVIREIGFFDLL